MSDATFDPKAFWAENALCLGKPFRTDKPRAPLSFGLDDHWLMEEMALPSSVRYYQDPDYQAETNRACNDRCEPWIGLRPYSETPPKPSPLRIELLLGSKLEIVEGGTPWLEAGHDDPAEFARHLETIDAWTDGDLAAAMTANGSELPRGLSGDHHVWNRGPVTMATSALGTERTLYWLIDEPDLMHRYFEVVARLTVRYHRLMAGGRTITGMCWLDDNCVLMSPDLYREFALPAMHHVMDALAGDTGYRFQHSDSAMGHLLPILAELRFDGVNLGPTVPVAEIRRHLPRTEIHGQLPPMLLRNGTLDEVEACIVRDFDEVGRDGGMLVTTAGSIAAGTSPERIQAFMRIVDRVCRYD